MKLEFSRQIFLEIRY